MTRLRAQPMAMMAVTLALGSVAACSSEGQGPALSTTPGAAHPVGAGGPGSPAVQPDAVAFRDAEHGLLAATLVTSACASGTGACPGGLIERTSDGGRTWQVVDRTGVPLGGAAVAPDGAVWVSGGSCGADPPARCSSELFVSAGGGGTWVHVTPDRQVTSVSPVSATVAWAVSGGIGAATPQGTELVRTTDGGRTWHVTAADPCGAASLALDAVDFATPAYGGVVCGSEPATDLQPKAVFTTADGGVHWTLESDCLAAERPGPDVGKLSCTGYLPQLDLLGDGHGWMSADRYGLASTVDGGRTWAHIATGTVGPAGPSATVAFTGDDNGFMLTAVAASPCSGHACGPELLVTRDAGATWTAVHTWPSPEAG